MSIVSLDYPSRLTVYSCFLVIVAFWLWLLFVYGYFFIDIRDSYSLSLFGIIDRKRLITSTATGITVKPLLAPHFIEAYRHTIS